MEPQPPVQNEDAKTNRINLDNFVFATLFTFFLTLLFSATYQLYLAKESLVRLEEKYGALSEKAKELQDKINYLQEKLQRK